jgi:hypothetical protein
VILCWRQGVKQPTRWKFWHHLGGILWRRPAVAAYYLSVCAHLEHLVEYRQMVRDQLQPRTPPPLGLSWQNSVRAVT